MQVLPAFPAPPETGHFHSSLPLQSAAATAVPWPCHSTPISQRDTALPAAPKEGQAAEAGALLQRARIAAGAVAATLLVVLLALLLLAWLRRRRAPHAVQSVAVRSEPPPPMAHMRVLFPAKYAWRTCMLRYVVEAVCGDLAQGSGQKSPPVATSPRGPTPRNSLNDSKRDTYVNHLFEFHPGHTPHGIYAVPMRNPRYHTPFVAPVPTSASTARIGSRPGGAPAAPPHERRLQDDESQGVGSISGSDSEGRDSWECEPGQVWRMHNECGSPGDLRLWREDYEEPWRPPQRRWHSQEPCCAPGALWKLQAMDEDARSGGLDGVFQGAHRAEEAPHQGQQPQHRMGAAMYTPAGVFAPVRVARAKSQSQSPRTVSNVSCVVRGVPAAVVTTRRAVGRVLCAVCRVSRPCAPCCLAHV